MSGTRIHEELRRLVRERAHGCCEYCLLHERDQPFRFHLDHVIAEKHGGPTQDHNLCLCCPDCNRAKGSDVSTVIGGKVVRLFNPRIDAWQAHFALDGPLIRTRTRIGAGTARLLDLNSASQLELRACLIQQGLYPGIEARRLLGILTP